MAPDVHDRVRGVPYNFAFIIFDLLIFVFLLFFLFVDSQMLMALVNCGFKATDEKTIMQKHLALHCVSVEGRLYYQCHKALFFTFLS